MIYALLSVIIAALVIKIAVLKRTARSVTKQFADRLDDDTNGVIYVNTADKDMRELASGINTQLKKLRARLAELRAKTLEHETAEALQGAEETLTALLLTEQSV